MKKFYSLLCIVIGAVLLPNNSDATPYASAVTINTNVSPTNVTFRLNEACSNVYVVYGNNADTNVLGVNGTGGAAVGLQSFNMTYNSVTYTNFAIYAFNIGTGSPHQISPNPASSGVGTNMSWYAARGVSVNRNASSTNFGKIYIAQANYGPTGLRTFTSTGKGVFCINPDFSDGYGYGMNAMPAGALYGASGTYSPYKIYVGPDDMVYVADGDWPANITPIGVGVQMMAPDLSTTTPLFPYNDPSGYVVCIGTPQAYGSYAAGTLDLYTLEWDRAGTDGNYQDVFHYQFYTTNMSGPNTPSSLPWDLSNIPDNYQSAGTCAASYPGYSGLPGNNPNTGICAGIGTVNTVLADFFIGPTDGRFYCVEERTTSATDRCLWVYDNPTNGACLLWDDNDAGGGSGTVYYGAYGVSISPDNQYLLVGSIASDTARFGGIGGHFLLSTLTSVNPNTSVGGLPSATPTAIQYNPGVASTVRGVAWDMADNMYGVSGSDDSIRVFSLGQTTLAITSDDISGTNGTFVLSSPTASAGVIATTPLASQNYGAAIDGTFTITNGDTNIADANATITYTLGGTATIGTDYTATPSAGTLDGSGNGSVSLAPGATATVDIAPVEDNISRPTLTVTLTVQGSAKYQVIAPGFATVYIANTGPQVLSVTGAPIPSMWRGNPNDYATVTVTRIGDTNNVNGGNGDGSPYTFNGFTLGGTAVFGTDYTGGPAMITINPGDITKTVTIGNPVSTAFPFTYKGDETIIVGVTNASGVTALNTTATVTLLDNAYPAETILWSDPLTSATDSTNWTVAFANAAVGTQVYPNYPTSYAGNNAPGDFDADFGFTLASDSVANAPNGSSTALKLTMNKKGTTTVNEGEGGVNAYPAGQYFSGDFALRFNMLVIEGTGSSATEYVQWGINHYGTNADWWAGAFGGGFGNTNIDGIWYSISSDQGGASFGDMLEFTGQKLPNAGWLNPGNKSELSFTNNFKHPPYLATGNGSPADGNGGDGNIWNNVEVKQLGATVTMSINEIPIFSFNNTSTAATNYTAGDVMLGYCDPFTSVGTVGAAYFSNARVVSLNPRITNVAVSGGNVIINFISYDPNDTTASFTLQSEAVISTPNGFANSAGAIITGSAGNWTATVPASGSAQFYRIHHN